MKKVRTLRHWKEQYNENAAFIWAKVMLYGGKYTVPGKKIPKELAKNKAKLKRFWEAKAIALALFEEPKDILRPTVAAGAVVTPDAPVDVVTPDEPVDVVTPEEQEAIVTSAGQEPEDEAPKRGRKKKDFY